MLMQEGDKAAGWQFTGAGQGSPKPSKPTSVKAVSWTASEYVEHDKSKLWFVWFALIAVGGIGLIFFITRDFISIIILGVLAVAFGFFAARKPNVLQYQLDNHGITIGQKVYPINLFRSFAIIEEGAFHSITLIPMKRFMPSISLYYAPDDEQAIMAAFGGLLPQETRQQDTIDKLMHRIRF